MPRVATVRMSLGELKKRLTNTNSTTTPTSTAAARPTMSVE